MQSTHTHTQIHPHTHIHIRMEPQSNSNPNCSSIFSNRLVSISRFLLNLPPPLAPRSLLPPPTGLSRGTTDRANWFLGRGSLHYAGTYVFKFHSCVAFFVFPFLCYSPPSTITHICMPDVCAGDWVVGKGVARLPRAERRR